MTGTFKRIVQSNGFKIYFWPISTCYLITVLCLYLFLPIEPESPKELAFVFICTFIWIFCLWLLVSRYRKITGKSVGKRAIILLVFILAVFFVGISIMVFSGITIYLLKLFTFNK
jgi:uncharacterized membrane protein